MNAVALSQLQKDYCILEMQNSNRLSIKQVSMVTTYNWPMHNLFFDIKPRCNSLSFNPVFPELWNAL